MLGSSHSKLGASAAHRWMRCPASVPMCRDMPDTAGRAAALGTVAHEAFEWCLRHGGTALDFDWGAALAWLPGDTQFREIAVHTERAVRATRKILAGCEEVWLERRVAYGAEVGAADEDAFGTADVIGVRGSQLLVVDYKSGRVPVAARGNEQVSLYALGAMRIAGVPRDVFTIIVQPSVQRRPDWQVRPGAEIAEWAETVVAPAVASIAEAERAISRDATRVASYQKPSEKGCMWCPAKSACVSYGRTAEGEG